MHLFQYLEDPANRIKIDLTFNHESAFRKLEAKRADYLVNYRRPSEKVLKAMDLKGIQGRRIMLVDIFLIVSKKTPNAEEVMNRLEKAFDELRKEGRLADIAP